MKSPKERQRAYRERRKEHKSAGLTKLKILASATAAKRLDILSEIDGADSGTVLGQAVELLWTQRFGSSKVAPESAAKPEIAKPAKPKKAKLEKEKAEKPEKAMSDKSKKKLMKSRSKLEAGNSKAVAVA